MFAKRFSISLINMMALLMLFSTAQQSSAKPNTMNRDEIQDRYKWNLNDIFADWDAWQATYDELEEGMKKLDNFKGTLHQGPERILECTSWTMN